MAEQLIQAPFLQLFTLNYVASKYKFEDMLNDVKFNSFETTMPTLRKTFIISLTIALSCLFYFGMIYFLESFQIKHRHSLIELHNQHLAIPILYLGYIAGLIAGGLEEEGRELSLK